MIEVLAAIGGGGVLVCVVALVVVTRWALTAKDAQVAEVKAHDETSKQLGAKTTESERIAFELATTKDALAESERVKAALAKEVADAIESVDLGAGLSPGDVVGRLLRIAAKARAAEGGVPAEPAEAVPVEPEATRPVGTEVLRLDPIDVLR